jgi:CheY-like chemotaxis protein
MAQFAPLTPATILIVEDDALVLMELADWMVELGLTVLTADNADQAIVLLDTHPEIELLLTDIEMPGSMDGVRLAHHVAERWPPVRIVVISGMFACDVAPLPALSIFVPKPLRQQELWQALSRPAPALARSNGRDRA